mmetsp:Transcript_42963/g.119582  ORF Transcript_42963/g.119582 Transcript_42963/m.119582 type:complete len:237 (-) Transcript_42963:155-865(-)
MKAAKPVLASASNATETKQALPKVKLQPVSNTPPYFSARALLKTMYDELRMLWPKNITWPIMPPPSASAPPRLEPDMMMAPMVIQAAPPEARTMPEAFWQDACSNPARTAKLVVKIGNAVCQVLPTVGSSYLRPRKKAAWEPAKQRLQSRTLRRSLRSGRHRPCSARDSARKAGPVPTSRTASKTSGLAPWIPNLERKEPPPNKVKTRMRAKWTVRLECSFRCSFLMARSAFSKVP